MRINQKCKTKENWNPKVFTIFHGKQGKHKFIYAIYRASFWKNIHVSADCYEQDHIEIMVSSNGRAFNGLLCRVWWPEIFSLPDNLSQYFLLSTVEFWEKDTGSEFLIAHALLAFHKMIKIHRWFSPWHTKSINPSVKGYFI